jgi:hypothetical protein
MQRTRPFSLIALMGLLLAGCAHRQTSVKISYLPPNAFTVSEESLHRVKRDDGSVPEQYWGAPLRTLKPLRVYDDRVNIAVVTEQRAHEERGVYFYRSISSYAPVDGPGRRFRWNAKTEQLEYVFTK